MIVHTSGLEIGGVPVSHGQQQKIWDTRFTGPGVPKGHHDNANFSTSVIKATISDVGSKINHQLG